MLPMGPLMIEHRLIEQVIAAIQETIERDRRQEKIDPAFVEEAIDFIRTYADRTHHGKEEDLYFRDLSRKDLSPEHRRLMQELIEEHREGRRIVNRLAEALRRYRGGDLASREAILNGLEELAGFYPPHIKKEDKVFFPQAAGYFDKEENEALLKQMASFDGRMIHEKYRRMLQAWAESGAEPRAKS